MTAPRGSDLTVGVAAALIAGMALGRVETALKPQRGR
jgi:hypothetical protein